MKRTITALLATLCTLLAGFAYPVLYKQYTNAYFSKDNADALADVLPFMLSVFLWMGILAGVAYCWARVFNEKLK